MEPEILVVDDVTSATLEIVVTTLRSAAATKGRAVMCLSGGSTPVPLYQRLAHVPDLPWRDTVITVGDERYVPHAHPDSNYGTARKLLIDHVPVAEENVLAWPEGPTPAAAAAAYGRDLAASLGQGAQFDINIMGLGPDGHTASLFPGTGAATREEGTFALEVPGFGWRLTMGAARLSASHTTLFLVSGEDKRRALVDTFGPTARSASIGAAGDPAAEAALLDRYPARAIGASDRLVVVTDVDFL